MGGNAFHSAYTPRMPEHVYRRVLEHVEARYKKHFQYVGHAIEAPGKSTYGDIDVLVAEPLDPSHSLHHPGKAFLAAIIQGQQYSRSSGDSTLSILISWPEEFASDIPAREDEQPSDSANDKKSAGIQVDVHICSTAKELNWMLFLHAYGDLWSMLGGIIRRFGLTYTPKGLFIRIEETEKYSKERSRVKLTDDPAQALQFLGLDVERYREPFTTLDAMMAYVATCRFHDPGRWVEKNSEAWKPSDRQRANKRPAFAYWADEYLPAHQKDPPGRDAHMTRVEVIESAKEFFGAEFASRFEEHRKEVVEKYCASNMWSQIRKSIPATGNQLGRAMKGLKAAILSTDSEALTGGDGELQQELEAVRIAYLDRRFDEVQAWSANNWQLFGGPQGTLEGTVQGRSLENAESLVQSRWQPRGIDVQGGTS